MHTHGIQVFNGADDDAVVVFITHHFHLELFPTDDGFFDQQFLSRRRFQPALANCDEFFLVVSNAATGTAHGKRRTDDGRIADHGLHLHRFFHGMGQRGTGRCQADLAHRLLKFFAVFRFVDGFLGRAYHLHAVFFQHAVLGEIQRAIQRRLPAHGG